MNPLLDQLRPCRRCGTPVFTFVDHDGGADPERETGDPSTWMTVDSRTGQEPIAGGVVPATACTNCGLITDALTDRAILWNVARHGSPVPKLVPQHPDPCSAVYGAEPEDIDLAHFLCLRGRWAADDEFEGWAATRLVDAERRQWRNDYTDEVVKRIHVLLERDRMSASLRCELLAELGRHHADSDPEISYQYLRCAFDTARDLLDDRDDGAPRGVDRSDVGWYAVDAAEVAHALGRDDAALEMLELGVPLVPSDDQDVVRRGAGVAANICAERADGDAELRWLLIELGADVFDGGGETAVDAAWPRIEHLLRDDVSSERLAALNDLVHGWPPCDARSRLLRLMADRAVT